MEATIEKIFLAKRLEMYKMILARHHAALK